MTPPFEVSEPFRLNLRRLRRRVGLSQAQLAARASLHRTEIGLLEKGERLPRIDTLMKLAASLEVPPGELLDGIEWVPSSGEAEGTFWLPESFGDPRSAAQGRKRDERHAELMKRAEALRARQPATTDVVALVREGRGEAGPRGDRADG